MKFMRLYNMTGGIGPQSIDCWYGANASNSIIIVANGWFDIYPMRALPVTRLGTAPPDWRIKRFGQLKESSDLVLLYDGFNQHQTWTLNGSVSARHHRNRETNCLFAD